MNIGFPWYHIKRSIVSEINFEKNYLECLILLCYFELQSTLYQYCITGLRVFFLIFIL